MFSFFNSVFHRANVFDFYKIWFLSICSFRSKVRFSAVFSSRGSTVLGFPVSLWSILSTFLYVVQCKVWIKVQLFLHMHSQLLKRLFFPPRDCFCTFVKNQLFPYIRTSGLSILFHWFCLFIFTSTNKIRADYYRLTMS